jgi:hypothetical protein
MSVQIEWTDLNLFPDNTLAFQVNTSGSFFDNLQEFLFVNAVNHLLDPDDPSLDISFLETSAQTTSTYELKFNPLGVSFQDQWEFDINPNV